MKTNGPAADRVRHASDEASTSTPSQAIELLETFMALMPDAALVVDPTGTIVSVNELALALFGYQANEIEGQPIEVLVPERFRHRHREDRARYFASPQVRPMGAGLELTGRRRDGREFAVDISLAPLSGVGGQLTVAAIRDASERRAATAAQAQLAAIVQSSVDAIISMTVEGEITAWNAGAEHLFGYRAEEVVGRHVSMLVASSESAVLEEML